MKSVLNFIKITPILQTKGHFFTQNNDPWFFSALNNEEGVIILRLKMTPVISLRVSRCQAQMIRSNSMLPFGLSYCYDNIYGNSGRSCYCIRWIFGQWQSSSITTSNWTAINQVQGSASMEKVIVLGLLIAGRKERIQ